ncbi:MAG: AsmA family protein [Deltaproteobacteria bacterium]|nr:AsmA family protein [Deltaproteobacteria bacterium]
MARRIRQIFISTGILLGLVVLLLIGVSFYLKTDHAQRLIQAKVNQAISGTITWEGGGFSFFGNNVELSNISVKGPAREKLMTMESLSVNISWAALLMGELAIETAMLHTPRVWLGTDAEGKLNVMRAFESSGAKKQEASKGGFPFNIAVRHLKIMNGFVSFKGDGGAKEERTDRAVLHNIELTVSDVNLMKRIGCVDLRIDKGEIHMAGIEAAVDEVRLYGALKEDRIDPLVLAVKINGSTLEISGNVGSLFSDPLLDIVLQGEICLPEIQEILQTGTGLTGVVKTSLTVRGSVNNPDVALLMGYGGGNLAGNRIDGMELSCHMEDRSLTIENMKVQTGKTWLELAGNYDFSSQELAATVKLESPDLAETFFSAGLPDIRGKVSGAVTLRGKLTSLLAG